ncbi:MAG TPA: isoprenylcysteine carboxylmethyltransferase family protein [Xanthobacteraceae bacterium]
MADSSNAVVRPPIALVLAIFVSLGIDWLLPLRFVPANIPARLLGVFVFALGLALAGWAIITFRAAGTHVETYKPTSTIVVNGPYRFTRNPIYTGMFVGLIGLAMAFNNLWMLAAVVPFYCVIRYGVIAREEAYLEGKFGDEYRAYKTRVRRWL